MTNGQYNATLTIFFVSYSLFEPLTNVLLKKMRPSVFLPMIMVRLAASIDHHILTAVRRLHGALSCVAWAW